jgi:glycosyltransferase involved in cell wall biosynthesis
MAEDCLPDAVIAVVLSTYNGEKWLPALLASLAAQSRRPNILVWRDDGSSDRSLLIVADWCRNEKIAMLRLGGANLGAAQSFLTAISAATSADIILLADQDDVWLETKIARAVAGLPHGPGAAPALYAARQRIVDARLAPIRDSRIPRHVGIRSAVCESVLTGCTMAINRPLAALVLRGWPLSLPMHDWWLYLLASATGTVVFDPEPTILYRQHGANVIGAKVSGLAAIAARLRVLQHAPRHQRSDQVRAFIDRFDDVITPAARLVLNPLVQARDSISKRIAAAIFVPIIREQRFNSITTRSMILLNRF